MSDLRKAAEMLIETHDQGYGKIAHDLAVEELRKALAQPEQVLTARTVITGREWVELTEDEAKQLYENSATEWQFAQLIETKLKEKNT